MSRPTATTSLTREVNKAGDARVQPAQPAYSSLKRVAAVTTSPAVSSSPSLPNTIQEAPPVATNASISISQSTPVSAPASTTAGTSVGAQARSSIKASAGVPTKRNTASSTYSPMRRRVNTEASEGIESVSMDYVISFYYAILTS